jgi:pyrroline-5-carboxylate reductase
VIEQVGIIGVGHLASYLVAGMRRASPKLEIFLSTYLSEMANGLASDFGATAIASNQAVADAVDTVLVSTRPGDILAACDSVAFRPNQTVVSTAVGVTTELLAPVVAPARIVRSMPITCSAINLSPTLLYPDNPKARQPQGAGTIRTRGLSARLDR